MYSRYELGWRLSGIFDGVLAPSTPATNGVMACARELNIILRITSLLIRIRPKKLLECPDIEFHMLQLRSVHGTPFFFHLYPPIQGGYNERRKSLQGSCGPSFLELTCIYRSIHFCLVLD